jgi:hypothetical protein
MIISLAGVPNACLSSFAVRAMMTTLADHPQGASGCQRAAEADGRWKATHATPAIVASRLTICQDVFGKHLSWHHVVASCTGNTVTMPWWHQQALDLPLA